MGVFGEASNVVGGHEGRGSGPAQEVVDPSTGEVIWSYPADTPEEVEAALEAAHAALPGWASATPADRSTALMSLARELESVEDELAQIETAQCGKPIRLSRLFDVPGSIDNVWFFAGAARQLPGQAAGEYSANHTSTIRREPVGVVGSIAPWNYPLQMAIWKILPAIAAGNTIVLKPAENTPATSLMVASAAARAGLPDGVINVVNGPGATTGEALISSPRIAMTSFTGSTMVGRHIAAVAGSNGTRLHLELGGKAPFVVFDDADLNAAARGAVAASLINTGQDCTAATRAYVHCSIFGRFVEQTADLMRGVRLGPPTDEDTDLGPLISFRHRGKVSGMVEQALSNGAKAVCGAKTPGGDLAGGAYYEPTLLVDAAQDSAIVQQEVFGPVLVVLPFHTDDEAIDLANDVPFGLAASAWTTDVFRAQRAARDIQAGTVWVNDHIPIISEMPHGGMKASGYGKDMSAYSLLDYTQIKHVMIDNTAAAHKEWHDIIYRYCPAP